MVIKLKEYGKYVIGVGIRESASDLLIQNCDEYYSYSDLAGPHQGSRHAVDPARSLGAGRRGRGADGAQRRRDALDRLKQVMQQIDPNFDERNAGFNRFSKFVVEAGQKGVRAGHQAGQRPVRGGAAGPASRPRRARPAPAAAAAPRGAPKAHAARTAAAGGDAGAGAGSRERDGRAEAAAGGRARRAAAAARPEGALTLARRSS